MGNIAWTLRLTVLTREGGILAADMRNGTVQYFRKNEEGKWKPDYIFSTPDKKGNIEAMTPNVPMFINDETIMVTESMAKQLAVFKIDWDNADPMETEGK